MSSPALDVQTPRLEIIHPNTHFRAVNLIADVIDECAGENVPAYVSYRNHPTP